MKFKRIDNEELSVKVYKLLLGMLKDGSFEGRKKLPPETVLPEKIGVSRSVIRDALGLLEGDGYVSRRRGIGTVINWDVVNTPHRLDLKMNLMGMVRERGQEPSVKRIYGGVEQVEGVDTFCLHKIIYADQEPVIYIEDTVPEKYIDLAYYEENLDDASVTIYDLMLSKNLMVPEFHLLTIDGLASGEVDIQEDFVRAGKVYFRVTEKGYNIDQEIILYSHLYYRADYFTLTLLKKNIHHPY